MIKNYWHKRMEYNEGLTYKKGEATTEEIARLYIDALRKIEKEILSFHEKYARNNKISLLDAQIELNRKERQELKWTVKRYMKKSPLVDLTGVLEGQLRNASIGARVTRLQSLYAQIIMHINDLSVEMYEGLNDLMSDVFIDSYWRNIYDVQRIKNSLSTFSVLPRKQIELMLLKPWTTDNITFSKRVWINRNKLINDLQSAMMDGLTRGYDVRVIAKDIANKNIDNIAKNQMTKDMRVKIKNAIKASERLVRSETSYFFNLARAKSYADLNIEQYQISATLDKKTTDKCQAMDSKIFDLKDRQVGINYPPFHCNCRTATVPYDEAFLDSTDVRVARGADGKPVYVPRSMDYKKWYKTYVER